MELSRVVNLLGDATVFLKGLKKHLPLRVQLRQGNAELLLLGRRIVGRRGLRGIGGLSCAGAVGRTRFERAEPIF